MPGFPVAVGELPARAPPEHFSDTQAAASTHRWLFLVLISHSTMLRIGSMNI